MATMYLYIIIQNIYTVYSANLLNNTYRVSFLLENIKMLVDDHDLPILNSACIARRLNLLHKIKYEIYLNE